mgnify:CR=1 FL=1
MNIGVSTASFYPLETEEALEQLGKAGVKYTEIFFNALSELKPAFIDILEDILDNYGIKVTSVHPTMSLAESFMIFSNYERRYYEAEEQYRRYSEIAARFGAKYIIMHGGKPNGLTTDEEYCERYMRLKDVTRENGVTVLQENVVKQIYRLCLAGNGPTKIARMLTEQQIPTPGTLEYQRTGSIRRYHPGYECKWATNTVVHLLENREYTGCLVNFKTEKPSYKMKHSIDNPIEKQAIFENHHEPIIDLQTWERVQELRKQRKRPNRYDDVGLFSGLLFCADCGHVMYQQRYQTDKRKQDCYICGSYKKRTADCTAHFIRTDLLTAGVLDNLRKVTAYAQKHEARFVKLLIQQNEMGGKRKQAAATKQLEQVQSRIAELSRYIKRLYEDNVNGKISDERFMEMSADYEAEQRELKEKAAALQGELDKAQEATVNAEKFMNVVRKYLSIEELTHTLLREMVEKIVVYECEYDENEVRRQRIDIYYSFVGKIDLPEE